MNEISFDPDEIRNVGNKAYPELAELYDSVIKDMLPADREDLTTLNEILIMGRDPWTFPKEWEEVFSSVRDYMEQVVMFLDTSARHLESCGETLVAMADDLCDTDDGNAYNINRPSSGRDIPDSMK